MIGGGPPTPFGYDFVVAGWGALSPPHLLLWCPCPPWLPSREHRSYTMGSLLGALPQPPPTLWTNPAFWQSQTSLLPRSLASSAFTTHEIRPYQQIKQSTHHQTTTGQSPQHPSVHNRFYWNWVILCTHTHTHTHTQN